MSTTVTATIVWMDCYGKNRVFLPAGVYTPRVLYQSSSNWWFQPHLKNMIVKIGIISPNRDENENIVELPPPIIMYIYIYFIVLLSQLDPSVGMLGKTIWGVHSPAPPVGLRWNSLPYRNASWLLKIRRNSLNRKGEKHPSNMGNLFSG